MTKIKIFLLKHEITITEIARATGVTRTCISNKASGLSTKWLFKEVFYISNKSGVPIENFIDLLDITFEG